MITLHRVALVDHSAEEMFALVEDIEAYPRFLPWCRSSEVTFRDPTCTVGTLHIDFRGVRQTFTTENRKQAPSAIEMALVKGPFRDLRGSWRFTPLASDACKVELALQYQFSSALLERIAGPAFEHIGNTLVDAFVRRADALRTTR